MAQVVKYQQALNALMVLKTAPANPAVALLWKNLNRMKKEDMEVLIKFVIDAVPTNMPIYGHNINSLRGALIKFLNNPKIIFGMHLVAAKHMKAAHAFIDRLNHFNKYYGSEQWFQTIKPYLFIVDTMEKTTIPKSLPCKESIKCML
jgi:hypothetical protein